MTLGHQMLLLWTWVTKCCSWGRPVFSFNISSLYISLFYRFFLSLFLPYFSSSVPTLFLLSVTSPSPLSVLINFFLGKILSNHQLSPFSLNILACLSYCTPSLHSILSRICSHLLFVLSLSFPTLNTLFLPPQFCSSKTCCEGSINSWGGKEKNTLSEHTPRPPKTEEQQKLRYKSVRRVFLLYSLKTK